MEMVGIIDNVTIHHQKNLIGKGDLPHENVVIVFTERVGQHTLLFLLREGQ